MLFDPFVFSKSRFQGPASRCDKIVVIVTLLEVAFQTKIITFGGTKTSTIFTRDYFMSENLRVDIKRGPLHLRVNLLSRIRANISLHQSLVKRKSIHCDFQDVSRTRVVC